MMTESFPLGDADEQSPLRLANDNPWYCLATLHGEQPEDHFDRALAEKNRHAWARWFADLTDDQRAELAKVFARRIGGKPLMPPERSAYPDFSHTRFDRRVVLVSFVFSETPDFSSAAFCADADFSEAQFHGPTNFSSARFSADVNFRSALFSVSVDFRSAMFSSKATFRTADITSPSFGCTTFCNSADFSSASFRRDADFQEANFRGTADFGSAKFTGVAAFGSAAFFEHASFRATTFSDVADFVGATVTKSIHFINAKFTGDTIFADVRFKGQVPDFRGATIHEATEWHGVTWPRPPRNKVEAQQQVYTYERLKQEMERLKKHEDEQNFFRKELRARRGLAGVLSGGWLLNFIYEWSSGYGNSIYLPVLWLTGVFVAGAAVFAHAQVCSGQPMSLKLAGRLSFANIFVFLPDKRELMAMPELAACLSNMTAALSAAQSLLGVVLLFLLGLALRNRYRMK